MKRLGPLVAILACCGVTLLVVSALLVPAGFLTSSLALGLLGLTAAGILVGLAVRSRRTCSGACHVPAVRPSEPERPGVRS